MYCKEKIINTLKEVTQEVKDIAPYVVIAQPRRNLEETPAQKLYGGHEGGEHVDFLGYSHGFCNIGGEKVDVARNYLIEQVLESGAKYMLFVGEDTVLPYDGFLNLHKTAEANPDAMVVGVYYIKHSSPMIMIRKDRFIVPADVTPGQVLEIWTSGLDCALIPVSMLQKIKADDPEIPFCCIYNGEIDGEPVFVGEDNFFEYRLRKAGFKILCNTDVQCLHVDLASGKYTAYPGVDLSNYFTNIVINGELTLADKKDTDKRWVERIPSK